MLIIQNILVSDALVEEHFLCNLKACQGICCVEGDFGAPLETEELHTLERIYDKVKPFLAEDGIAAIEKDGLFIYEKEEKEYTTPLIKGGPCAYRVWKDGIVACGIELAYLAKEIDFKKPISCHLYPIRVKENKKTAFEALNYDEWDICSAACALGKKEELPVYQFLKEPIIRKYGTDFYDELDAAAKYLKTASP